MHYFDKRGFYKGHIDESGYLHDKLGNLLGQLKDSQYFDRRGVYKGEINDQGYVLDKKGYLKGQIIDE